VPWKVIDASKEGPRRERDGRHTSEGHESWEEAERGEDTEESGLQPSLHFFGSFPEIVGACNSGAPPP
jgi:hypothetical protein